MKMILTNGTELNVLTVLGEHKIIRSVSRDVLTFVFPATESMETLDSIFTAENCETITLVDDNGNSYEHKGYIIRVEIAKINVETDEGVFEDRITVSMAQQTQLEYEASETMSALNALAGLED